MKRSIERCIAGLRSLGGDRGPWIVRAIEKPVERILDVGCAYGWTLHALTEKGRELVGVDMDHRALSEAQCNYPNIKFIHQTAAALPFGDGTFDVVILSEVIEHVGNPNKHAVVDEVYRVLRPGGLLVFTAPYAGAFAWADPMDFKRRFPRLYRMYMRLTSYEPETPVEIGHEHVSLREIHRLFGERFEIKRVYYCGLFMPFLTWILAMDSRVRLLPPSIHDAINKLRGWESGIQYGAFLSFNIRLTAVKATDGLS